MQNDRVLTEITIFGYAVDVRRFFFHPCCSSEPAFMISTSDRQALLALCNKFINSGEDVTLAHLLDLLNSTILDHESADFRDWSKYMEKLNETWVLINKENEQIPWPEVCKYN
jgi:hypothetical protein